MADDITALRTELFATLRGLRDEKNPIDVDTARAVVEVGKVIIDSARVEVEMTRITGQQSGSGFVPLAAPPVCFEMHGLLAHADHGGDLGG